MLLAEAWCRTLAVVIAAMFVLVVLDFVFRLPRPVRVLHLAALGYGGYVVVRRVLVPAMRFRPREAEIALRIERAEDAARARDRLASGLELGSGAEGAGGASGDTLAAAMTREAAREADSIASELGGRRFVSSKAAGRAGMVLAATLLVVSAAGLFRPQLAGIGLTRTLWPFAGTAWPKRTVVADATGIAMHPIGEALPMRAVLTRTHLSPGNTEVIAFYRVISGGDAGARQRVVLTSQQRRESVGGAEGELFERLIEPAGVLAEGDEIEYWFETEDNRTESARVRLAERPRVTRISATVTPPEYAAEVRGSFLAVEDLAVSRDSGGVAVVQPVLAGSSFAIRLTTNKAASLAVDSGERDGSAGVVGAQLPEGWTREDDRTLVYAGVAGERTRIDVELLGEDGLVSTEPVAVVLQVTSDAPAAVTITDPPYDESVLATASVGLRAEARDDLGMRWLALERQSATPPAGSEGAAPEGADDAVRLGAAEAEDGESALALTVEASLDLASIGVRAGDEVWLTAVGRDIFAAAEDPEADPRVIRSAVRRLRIIDEATFVSQIQGELAGVRRAAIEIDAAQMEVGAAVEAGEDDEQRARAERQASLTDRLDAQRGAIQRLGTRAERNGLDDDTLEGMLDDAAALLREATEASEEATSALERSESAPEAATEAEAAQQQVRENLESLISMLDQGQDNWVARRTVEGLLAEQRELAADTQALGDQTMGRSREQLSAEELTELERIAERQRDAAERARRALDSLAERAEALERFDAAQADAMSQAARRGRQERVEQQMREAASQVDQNQTRAAAQGQQAAAEALEQMLEDIDSADEARDEALRRVLASVLDSLESLIDEQEAQIDALALLRDDGALPGLAEPMVRLASNTLGLLDEIGPQRDLASVASLIGLAADAQERAVGALREGSRDSADDAERESLSKLQDARMEAERLEEQAQDRESARKRAELRTAYRELLEQQVAIVTDTQPMLDVELDRRARAQVRALGQRQGGVGESLTALRDATEELAEATVFDLAHRRIESASRAAEEKLLGGTADGEVVRRQASIVRLLQSLLAALAEENQPPGASEQQAGGGGGGGSGGETPIVPEIAELKLLRAMQAEAMEWTRNLDEAGRRPLPTELSELADLQSELAGRAAELVEKLTQGQQGPDGGGAEESNP